MSLRAILSIFFLLTLASPALGNPAVGPTYWDIIFELGYDPVAGRSSDDRACRRIEMVNEFSRRMDHHAEADQRLAAADHEKKLIAELKAFKEQLWSAFYLDHQTAKQARGCR